MALPLPEPPPSNLNVHSILDALFKHKWKIIICTLLGLIAAAAVHFLYPVVYESQAKLLVRYVLERSPVDSVDTGTTEKSSGRGAAVIGSEVEILTSWDLAMQVVEGLGVKRILPNSPDAPKNVAAGTVSGGLTVVAGGTGTKGSKASSGSSNILFVAYDNRDPQIATLVLEELVNRYFVKHLEVHRSAGAFEFVTQQTDQVRARLNQIEDSLTALKAKTGIISVNDATAAISGEVMKIGDQLRAIEEEIAEKGGPSRAGSAGVDAVKGAQTASPSPSPVLVQPASNGDVQQYQALVHRLEQLRQSELVLLSKYTPLNSQVKATRSQIDDLEKQRRDLEKKFPELASKGGGTTAAHTDVASLEAKAARLRARVKQLSEVAPQIADLERNKALEETNYKYFKGTLEKARVDEALDPTKMPNISAVQRPSPPIPVTKTRDRMVLGLAGGGLALGIGIALLTELFLSRTVKRPLELEAQLHAPVLLSIPYLNGARRLRLTDKGGNGKAGRALKAPDRGKIAPWALEHFIRPYAEAVRDRLSLYFELNGLTHKPKLVGVTGMSAGAGASTLAAGLAAALSELSNGKVLLVDVNLGPEHVHEFSRGRPALPLTAALKAAAPMTPAADNLYLATASSSAPGPAQLGLKKFFDLMPNMKASDFDYIIFDMPPLTDTSPTIGISGFLDRTLLVTEAEKSNREVVKRRYRALSASRDNVSIVLNKTRTYTPKWLDGES